MHLCCMHLWYKTKSRIHTYICSFSSYIYIFDRRWITSFFLGPSFILNVKENTLKSMAASIIGSFPPCEIENHWHSHLECHRTKWNLHNEKSPGNALFQPPSWKYFSIHSIIREFEIWIISSQFLARKGKHDYRILRKSGGLALSYTIFLNFYMWSNTNCVFLIFCAVYP